MPQLTTKQIVETEVPRISTPIELEQLRRTLELRADWHEPDESNVNAYPVGNHLDNAMPAGWYPEDHPGHGEFGVIITKHSKPVAVVNLAMLLYWASLTGRRFIEMSKEK